MLVESIFTIFHVHSRNKGKQPELKTTSAKQMMLFFLETDEAIKSRGFLVTQDRLVSEKDAPVLRMGAFALWRFGSALPGRDGLCSQLNWWINILKDKIRCKRVVSNMS
eukprot:TRINITY_DN2787_c1_g1_i5.p2 TRINITY_DN2787_c1_g1~~TRINITY_DN2787_c1_g1_i5.p2  ORF type:complete len:109 (-),score=17.30 TRINITY_DN2787_c1_g1_i5:51-377(-)